MEQFLYIDWERCHLSRAVIFLCVNPIALSWFFTKKRMCAYYMHELLCQYHYRDYNQPAKIHMHVLLGTSVKEK